jgi:hypothetical protein
MRNVLMSSRPEGVRSCPALEPKVTKFRTDPTAQDGVGLTSTWEVAHSPSRQRGARAAYEPVPFDSRGLHQSSRGANQRRVAIVTLAGSEPPWATPRGPRAEPTTSPPWWRGRGGTLRWASSATDDGPLNSLDIREAGRDETNPPVGGLQLLPAQGRSRPHLDRDRIVGASFMPGQGSRGKPPAPEAVDVGRARAAPERRIPWLHGKLTLGMSRVVMPFDVGNSIGSQA